jgi:FkbM family methyltransferase
MQIISTVNYYIRSVFSLLTGFKKPIQVISEFLGFSGKNSVTKLVQLKSSGILFHVRNAMDIWSIKETFLDDFYHFEKSIKPKKGVIIDIGAGIGEFTIQTAKACLECKVFGFEPFPESFDYLVKNLETNTIKNIVPIPAAVTSLPGAMVLDTSSGNPLQFRMQAGILTDSPTKTILLMDFLRENSISNVELLKLDCEGGEFDILLPLQRNDLIRFKTIVLEYHDSLTSHNHHELVQLLKDAGFDVETKHNTVHSDLGYIYAQFTQEQK